LAAGLLPIAKRQRPWRLTCGIREIQQRRGRSSTVGLVPTRAVRDARSAISIREWADSRARWRTGAVEVGIAGGGPRDPSSYPCDASLFSRRAGARAKRRARGVRVPTRRGAAAPECARCWEQRRVFDRLAAWCEEAIPISLARTVLLTPSISWRSWKHLRRACARPSAVRHQPRGYRRDRKAARR